jgi:FKBP12-rapamycin complex-associated protein
MLKILLPLHAQLNQGPETISEVAFNQAYSADLQEAETWLIRYQQTNEEIDLQQAWNIYFAIYQKLKNKLAMKTVELKNISPKLSQAENLQLSVPGNKNITIVKFY